MESLADRVRQIALEYSDRQQQVQEYARAYWITARKTAERTAEILDRLAHELTHADDRIRLHPSAHADSPGVLLTCRDHFLALHTVAVGDRVQLTTLQDGSMTPTAIYSGEYNTPRIEQIVQDTLTQWFDGAL